MALSPSISQSPSVTASSSSAAIKLRGVSTQKSVNEWESAHTLQSDVDRELTELLNDDVQHKYVKGTRFSILFLSF
jgi:hypothetical protein